MEGAVAEAADSAAAAAGARTSLCAEKEKKEKERVHVRVPNKIVFDVCSKEILKHDILCES